MYYKNKENQPYYEPSQSIIERDGLIEITKEEFDDIVLIINTPTAEEQKQIIYNQWKAERQSKVDNIEVELNGVIYQGDETSQTRIARNVAVMEDTDTTMWVAKDNSVNALSKANLKYILKEAGIKQTLIWNDGRPEGSN